MVPIRAFYNPEHGHARVAGKASHTPLLMSPLSWMASGRDVILIETVVVRSG